MDTSAHRIFVVDDDADTLSNLADLFGEFGFRIKTATSGELAIKEADRQRFDLALLDLRMADIDGLTLSRRLKQIQPDMVMMIVSAYPEGVYEKARETGVHCVLTKPIDFPRLLDLVKNALANLN